MKHMLTISLTALIIACVACDEGRIYDETGVADKSGVKATLSGYVSGNYEWGDGYALSLAGFIDGSEYAIISKDVMPDVEGRCNFILEGISSETNTVELCIIDRLRRRVATFAAAECHNADVRIVADGIDISMFGTIQRDIFTTTCAQCHGGAGTGAADLLLTEGESYSNLVGVPSVKEPGRQRVLAGDAAQSLLYEILASDASASWHYDHSVEGLEPTKLDLIKNWINNGASK